MVQLQTVVGFFDNIAEAQQAVQLLLDKDFTGETLNLSTQTGLNTTASNAPTEADGSSGRFFFSLFSSPDEAQSQRFPDGLARSQRENAGTGFLVSVQTQSAAETKQVADLLNTAGAGDVAVQRTRGPGTN